MNEPQCETEERAEHAAHQREEDMLHREHVKVEEEIHREYVKEEEELHEAHEHEEERERPSGLIELTVRTPIGDWTHGFVKTEMVSQVVAATLGHFTTLEPGDYKLERKTSKEMLDPNRTLESYFVQNCEVLKLVPPDGGGQ